METIVIGYDGSEASDRALERAFALTKAFGAKLVVASVARVLVPGPRGMGGIDPVDDKQLHEQELAAARTKAEAAGVAADYVLGVGDPATVIVDLLEERSADLVILGTREPGLLDRILTGSVSSSVARRAHCDVLIVH